MNLEKLRNMRDVDIVLANPNRRQLGVVQASDINLTLRFNDISECSMNVQSHVANAQGKKLKHPYYSKVQTQRLIHISNIGWFKILQCEEIDSGVNSYKSIRCESFQKCLNNYGFFCESKPYLFYDKNDVDGKKYRELEKKAELSSEDMQRYKEALPSVVGELFQQLQIQLDPRVTQLDDSEAYYFTNQREDWTIEFISPALRGEVVRSFDDSKTFYGYEWIQNQAAIKFECIFIFDFNRLSIRILTIDEVTKRTNIFLDYSNVVNELKTTEKADDIVTILNVNGGGGLDIQPVSPTGSNYLANFDYYKYNFEKDEGDWMSKELTLKLNEWEDEVKAIKEPSKPNGLSEWEQLVLDLRALYQKKSELESDHIYIQKKFEDLKAATSMHKEPEKIKAMGGNELSGNEIFTSEEVYAIERVTMKHTEDGVEYVAVEDLGERIWKKEYSFDKSSKFYVDKIPFSRDKPWKCYQKAPIFVRTKSPKKEDGSDEFAVTGLFVFEENNKPQTKEDGSDFTFDENYLTDFLDNPSLEWKGNYIYFVDTSEQTAEAHTENEEDVGAEVKGFSSYCKLIGEVMSLPVDEDGTPGDPAYHVSKFARYNVFTNAKQWEEIYEELSKEYIAEMSKNDEEIKNKKAAMELITSRLNLENRFDLENDEEKKLFKELRDYWFESEYTNEGFCLYDDTTPEEMIDLARELYDDGSKVLRRINRPTLSISVDTNDFTKIKEFEMFARELGLGKIITICKSEDEGIFYYPALTTINLSLDSPELSLEFSNALRPDSSDFMFMDLVNKGVDASKSVSANSREWSSYARKEHTIEQFLYDPLNRVLRISSGSTLQDVVVDSSGILLRKFTDEDKGAFDPRQCRLLGNVMIFTNDSWQTARTALGEIMFPDPENPNEDIHAYGILAEALIGSLIIGETLYIKNKENTISLNEDGIIIKTPKKDEDDNIIKDSNGNIEYEDVFKASSKGDVFLKGHIEATSGKIGELMLEAGNLYSQNFSLNTDAGGVTTLSVQSGDGNTTTTVNNLGVRSNNVDCIDLSVANSVRIGGTGDFDGFAIDRNSIRAASGEIIFNDLQDSGNPQHYTARAKLELGTGGNVTTTISITDRTTGEPSELLRTVVFTGTFMVSATLPQPLGYTYAERPFKVTVKAKESFNSSTTYEGTLWKNVGMVSWALGTQVASGGKIDFMQSPASGESVSFVGNLLPQIDATYNIGDMDAPARWNEIHCVNIYTATQENSDRNKKNTILPLDDKYSLLFDKLKPVSFKYNDGTSGRTHTGFIAQDLIESATEVGIDSTELAAYWKRIGKDGEEACGIKYTEIIAIAVAEIQKLKNEIRELKQCNDTTLNSTDKN